MGMAIGRIIGYENPQMKMFELATHELMGHLIFIKECKAFWTG